MTDFISTQIENLDEEELVKLANSIDDMHHKLPELPLNYESRLYHLSFRLG